MHIESITIEGFRSFAHPTTVTFDAKHTVVFGKNGSGKSTLLAAVAFVLHPDSLGKFPSVFSSLNQYKNLNVKVEIILVDDDRRSIIERKLDEDGDKKISIKREVSRNKESFYLNNKVVSSKGIADFLATVGVNPSNPFHFVRQGEINRLATTTPVERLKLLENFSGMTAYKKNSGLTLAKLEVLEKKMITIGERIKDIEEEVDFQKKEGREFDKFKKVENRVKAIQMHILLDEEKNLAIKLKGLKKQNFKELSDLKSEYEAGKRALKRARRMKEELMEKESILRVKREIFTTDLELALKELEKTNQDQATAMSRVRATKQEQALAVSELGELSAKAFTARDYLKTIEGKASVMRQETDECESKISGLSHFRDTYLRIKALRQKSRINCQKQLEVEAEQIKEQIVEQSLKIENLEKELQKVNAGIKECAEDLTSLSAQLNMRGKDIQNSDHQIEGLNRDIHAFKIESGHLRRRLMSEQLTLELHKNSCRKAKFDLLEGAGMRVLKDGIQSLETIIDHLRANNLDLELVNGLHGYVADLFENDKSFDLSISTAVGGKLFYAVVSHQSIAQGILKWQKNLKLKGEINFMPINLIRRREHFDRLPRASGYEKMIQLINYDEHNHKDVINQIFGREIVLKSMEDFQLFKGLAEVNCVTLDGQRCTGNGVITGGYYNQKDSKLSLYRKYQLQTRRRIIIEERVDSLMKEINEVEQQLQKHVNIRENIIENLDQDRSSVSKLNFEISSFHNVEKNLFEQERILCQQLAKSRLELVNSEKTLEAMTTIVPEEHIEEKNIEIRELQHLLKLKLNGLLKIEKEGNEYRNLLQFNLEPRIKELEMFSNPLACKGDLETTETCKEKSKILGDACRRLEDEKNECDEHLKHLVDRSMSNLKEIEDLESNLSMQKLEVDGKAKEIEKHHQQIASLDTLIQKVGMKKDHLGVVDDELVNSLADCSINTCHNLLKKQLKKLKAFGNVNKASHKRLVFLTEHLEKFIKRRKQFEVDLKCAAETLQIIKQTKREKLEWTRSRVSINFQSILKELCPSAEGNLLFEPRDSEDSNHSSSESSLECPDDPVGLRILVQFGSSSSFVELGSLSGGQKTCVALAFIFAVQKCDPAPFYIMDEVDACLDVQTRQRLANWLQTSKESFGLQYITTTFRKELVEVADKLVKVEFGTHSSNISEVSKEEGIEFLTESFKSIL